MVFISLLGYKKTRPQIEMGFHCLLMRDEFVIDVGLLLIHLSFGLSPNGVLQAVNGVLTAPLRYGVHELLGDLPLICGQPLYPLLRKGAVLLD